MQIDPFVVLDSRLDPPDVILLQKMKLDPEAVYNNQRSSNEHDNTKGIMINTGKQFIHATENHFVIDALNEEKHVLSLHNGGKKFDDNHNEEFVDVENSEDISIETFHSAQAHEFELALKEDFYSDKIVMKEDFYDCHTIKDIIVDEGVPSPTKAGNEELNLIASSACNLSLDNGPVNSTRKIACSSALDDTNMDKEQKGPALVSHDNSNEEIDVIDENNTIVNSDSVEVKHDSSSDGDASCSLINNVSKVDQTEFGLGDENNSSSSSSVSQSMLNTNESVPDNPILDSDKVTKHLSEKDPSSLVFSDEELVSADKQKDQAKLEECDTTITTLAELIKAAAEAHVNQDMPGRVVSFRIDKEAATTSGRTEIEEIKDNQHTETDEKEIDSASTSARCSFRHLIQKDPDIMGPDITSGPVVNSGHIPYSGSISFRSESSATSARSFAFPILQSEWNSSPVKMKKAKRRNRWRRMGLVCCGF